MGYGVIPRLNLINQPVSNNIDLLLPCLHWFNLIIYKPKNKQIHITCTNELRNTIIALIMLLLVKNLFAIHNTWTTNKYKQDQVFINYYWYYGIILIKFILEYIVYF